MQKILHVAIAELRVAFAERSIWLNLLVIPAALIVVVGFANGGTLSAGGDAPVYRPLVDIIDNDQSALSAQLIAALRETNPNLQLCPLDNNEDDLCRLNGETLTVELGADRVDDNVSEAVIEIPAGFGETMLAGQTVELAFRSEDDPGTTSAVLTVLQAASQRVNSTVLARNFGSTVGEGVVNDSNAFGEQVYDRANAIWADTPIAVEFSEAAREVDVNQLTPGFRQSVPGMGSMYVMFTVLAGAVVLIQERKNWTLQRLMTMPVTRGQFLAGKILARFVLGMIQFAVAFGVGFVLAQITGINFGNSPLALLLVMVAFVLCVSALALLLATLVTREEQAAGLVTLLALTLAPIGGAWWSLELEFIPEFMRQIAVVSPIYWAMEGFNNVILFGGGIPEVLVPVGVLLAVTAVLFGLAVARFRV